jgi:hypothetical protein
VTELRVSPDGLVAQLVHLGPRREPGWLCMTAPDGLLAAVVYTEDEVAAWTPLPLPTPDDVPPCCTTTPPSPR